MEVIAILAPHAVATIGAPATAATGLAGAYVGAHVLNDAAHLIQPAIRMLWQLEAAPAAGMETAISLVSAVSEESVASFATAVSTASSASGVGGGPAAVGGVAGGAGALYGVNTAGRLVQFAKITASGAGIFVIGGAAGLGAGMLGEYLAQRCGASTGVTLSVGFGCGALAGAAAGALAGTFVFPVIGTSIGAAVGVVGGLVFYAIKKIFDLFGAQNKTAGELSIRAYVLVSKDGHIYLMYSSKDTNWQWETDDLTRAAGAPKLHSACGISVLWDGHTASIFGYDCDGDLFELYWMIPDQTPFPTTTIMFTIPNASIPRAKNDKRIPEGNQWKWHWLSGKSALAGKLSSMHDGRTRSLFFVESVSEQIFEMYSNPDNDYGWSRDGPICLEPCAKGCDIATLACEDVRFVFFVTQDGEIRAVENRRGRKPPWYQWSVNDNVTDMKIRADCCPTTLYDGYTISVFWMSLERDGGNIIHELWSQKPDFEGQTGQVNRTKWNRNSNHASSDGKGIPASCFTTHWDNHTRCVFYVDTRGHIWELFSNSSTNWSWDRRPVTEDDYEVFAPVSFPSILFDGCTKSIFYIDKRGHLQEYFNQSDNNFATPLRKRWIRHSPHGGIRPALCTNISSLYDGYTRSVFFTLGCDPCELFSNKETNHQWELSSTPRLVRLKPQSNLIQLSQGQHRERFYTHLLIGKTIDLPEMATNGRFSFWAFDKKVEGTVQFSQGWENELYHTHLCKGPVTNLPAWAGKGRFSFWAYEEERPGTTQFSQGWENDRYYTYLRKGDESLLPAWAGKGRFSFFAYSFPPCDARVPVEIKQGLCMLMQKQSEAKCSLM